MFCFIGLWYIGYINVVAQPGATLPYSEFNGLKISPHFVLKAIIYLKLV